jgi:hypothetical protein
VNVTPFTATIAASQSLVWTRTPPATSNTTEKRMGWQSCSLDDQVEPRLSTASQVCSIPTSSVPDRSVIPGRLGRTEYMGNTLQAPVRGRSTGLVGVFSCRLAFGFPVEGWNLKVIFWLLDVKQTNSCHN